MVVAGALGLLLSWWAGPIDDAQIAGQEAQGIVGASRIGPPLFISRGIAPIGYFLFAFAVGVLAGTLIRRTVAAMAVTAVVFTLVQLAVPQFVRAHLNPVVTTTTVTPDNLGGFMLSGEGRAGGRDARPDRRAGRLDDRQRDDRPRRQGRELAPVVAG